jgi:hypothetical protein
MLSARIPKKTPTPNTLRPVLPLIVEKRTTVEDDKTRFITIELPARVNAPTGATTYKKYIRKFEEGTPQEWIDLQGDIQEIWEQNTIMGGTDRASTARALLCGESLTSFEASLEEARRNDDNDEEDGAPLPIDIAMVDDALTAVAITVFPHRTLEIQRLWMTRGMRKPHQLTTRKTAAAIRRINNALPLFPGGTDASKFSNAEVIGLLEWSLPPSWRSKFDLDGYIPTVDTKAKLIKSCEAIERNQNDTPQAKPTHKDKKAKSEKSSNGTKNRESRTNNKYCSEHGKNSTHNTSDCSTLKNHKDKGQNGNEKNGKTVGRSFSNSNFRKELNAMAKSPLRRKRLTYTQARSLANKLSTTRLIRKKPRQNARFYCPTAKRTVVILTNHFI